MAHEINLVPDIKNEMIKTLKLRNYITFACIVVVAASIGTTFLFGSIMGGQRLALESKKTALEELSTKLSSFTDLGDYLTIKQQVDTINNLSDKKDVLSRTFNILSAILPRGEDTITVSELSINLTEEQPSFTIDAQANAAAETDIDYNVLDSFKKSMQYMHYDYGNYVDKEGNTIPAYCMIEQGDDGAVFRDADKGYYAYWTIEGEGCKPSGTQGGYDTERYGDQDVVKVWRTPQFDEWHKSSESSNKPYMGLEGQIKNVPHFESSCITYSGTEEKGKINWDEINKCDLVSGDNSGENPEASGIKIVESSNGRDSNNNLVLRFTATITFNPEVYEFKNNHMLALAPPGQVNVTDSYVQIQQMFSKRAKDCAAGDTACANAKTKAEDQ